MEFLGPLSVMMITVFSVAFAAAGGLAASLNEGPGDHGAFTRAVAALSAGAYVPFLIVWGALHAVNAHSLPLLILICGVVPLFARRTVAWSAQKGGYLHRVAAWPIWSLAVCLSGVFVAGGEIVTGFLFLLAPALLLGVAAMDAMKPAKVRTNAEVLAFLAPTHGLDTCAVCQEAVRNRKIACPQCKAVQHRECWEFNGSCGGCASQRLA